MAALSSLPHPGFAPSPAALGRRVPAVGGPGQAPRSSDFPLDRCPKGCLPSPTAQSAGLRARGDPGCRLELGARHLQVSQVAFPGKSLSPGGRFLPLQPGVEGSSRHCRVGPGAAKWSGGSGSGCAGVSGGAVREGSCRWKPLFTSQRGRVSLPRGAAVARAGLLLQPLSGANGSAPGNAGAPLPFARDPRRAPACPAQTPLRGLLKERVPACSSRGRGTPGAPTPSPHLMPGSGLQSAALKGGRSEFRGRAQWG